MLLFKKEYFEKIRNGSKITTLRFWKTRRAKPGSIHSVPNLGKLKIISVDTISLDMIRDSDAQDDGFSSALELRLAIDKLYPPASREGRKLYKVKFEYISD